jgi:hypothetical protein
MQRIHAAASAIALTASHLAKDQNSMPYAYMPIQSCLLELVWRLLIDMRMAFSFHAGILVVQ